MAVILVNTHTHTHTHTNKYERTTEAYLYHKLTNEPKDTDELNIASFIQFENLPLLNSGLLKIITAVQTGTADWNTKVW